MATQTLDEILTKLEDYRRSDESKWEDSLTHGDAKSQIKALFLDIIGEDVDVQHWAKNNEQRIAMTTANQLRAELRQKVNNL